MNDSYLPVPGEEKTPEEDFSDTGARSKESIVRHGSYSGYGWLDSVRSNSPLKMDPHRFKDKTNPHHFFCVNRV